MKLPPVVFLSHPYDAPTRRDQECNRENAARWAAWLVTAAHVSPECSWITLTGVLRETAENRRRGLAANRALIQRCDAVLLVGGRITDGMREDAAVAKLVIDWSHLVEPPMFLETATLHVELHRALGTSCG